MGYDPNEARDGDGQWSAAGHVEDPGWLQDGMLDLDAAVAPHGGAAAANGRAYIDHLAREAPFVRNDEQGKDIRISMAGNRKVGEGPKAATALAIKTILGNMAHLEFAPDRKNRPNVKGFHLYGMPVVHEGKRKRLAVFVREDNNGHLWYDLGLGEGTKLCQDDGPWNASQTAAYPLDQSFSWIIQQAGGSRQVVTISLAEQPSAGQRLYRAEVLRVGRWDHPALPEGLLVTPALLDELLGNFEGGAKGFEVQLCRDHDDDRPCGWVKGLERSPDGTSLYALFDITDGPTRALVDEGTLKFTSSELAFGWQDPEDGRGKNVFEGLALTNRPFVKRMAPVQAIDLSEDANGRKHAEEGSTDGGRFVAWSRESSGSSATAEPSLSESVAPWPLGFLAEETEGASAEEQTLSDSIIARLPVEPTGGEPHGGKKPSTTTTALSEAQNPGPTPEALRGPASSITIVPQGEEDRPGRTLGASIEDFSTQCVDPLREGGLSDNAMAESVQLSEIQAQLAEVRAENARLTAERANDRRVARLKDARSRLESMARVGRLTAPAFTKAIALCERVVKLGEFGEPDGDETNPDIVDEILDVLDQLPASVPVSGQGSIPAPAEGVAADPEEELDAKAKEIALAEKITYRQALKLADQRMHGGKR